MKRSERIKQELERIAARHGGKLQPEAVVEAARPPSSPLHSKFTWDDGEAAQQYRIWQARTLIRITVTVVDEGGGRQDRVWVSLKQDRVGERGGYRKLVTVLSNDQLRQQLLSEAAEEMAYFEEKYQRLRELSGVISVMRKTRKRIPAIAK